MRISPPADRALDILSDVVIYRVIGRRPSKVYVDSAMKPTGSPTAQHRLSDLVYWRTLARPGDQIQDRPGGTFLVTAAGQCHRIRLSPPRPLQVPTAFTHAERAIREDRESADRLLAEGAVTEAAPRRPKGPPSRPLDRMLAERHPLVVDKPPESLFQQDDAPPRRGFQNWTRSAKPANG